MRRLAALALAAGAAIAAWLWPRGGRQPAERAVLTRIDRVTGEPGVEGAPSLSPDGQWIVVQPATGGMTSIYLQAVGGERPLNLTPGVGGRQRPAGVLPRRHSHRLPIRPRPAAACSSWAGPASSCARSPTPASGRRGRPTGRVSPTAQRAHRRRALHLRRRRVGVDAGYRIRPADPAHRSRRHAAVVVAARSPHRLLGRRPGRRRTATSGRCRSAAARRCGSPTIRPSTRRRSGRRDGRFLYFSSSRSGDDQPLARADRRNDRGVPLGAAGAGHRADAECACTRASRAMGAGSPTWHRPGASDVYALGLRSWSAPPSMARRGGSWAARFTGRSLRPSPDGQRLAFIRAAQQQRPGRDRRRRHRTSSGSPTSASAFAAPAGRRDGRTIVVLPTRRGDKDLIFIEPDGGRIRRLTDLPSTGTRGLSGLVARRHAHVCSSRGPTDPAVLIFDPTRPLAGQQIERLPAPSARHLLPARLVARRHAASPAPSPIRWSSTTRAPAPTPSSRRPLEVVAASDHVLAPRQPPAARRHRAAGDRGRRHRHRRGAAGLLCRPGRLRGFALSASRRELYVSRGPEEADIWIATIQPQ